MATVVTEVRPTTVDELRGMGQALFEEHWAEAGYSDTLPVDIDWKRYYKMEDADCLLVLGAFERGLLVGYCVTVLGMHQHCQALFSAVVDSLFVWPPVRRDGIGMRLIRETEKAARERGARELLWHAPKGSVLEMVLGRLGYRVREVVYERAL